MQANVMNHIKERGFGLIVTDRDPNCVGSTVADLFFCVDIHDFQAHITLIDYLSEIGIVDQIRGVSCIATDSHLTVAHISQKLGLPGISTILSSEIGDKWKLRRNLKACGVRQPSFLHVGNSMRLFDVQNQIESFMGESNADSFLFKPIGLSASAGLRIVRSEQEYEIASVIEEVRRASRNGDIIVEEKIGSDGSLSSEASIETVVQDGRVQFVNMVDRIFDADLTHFTGENIPKRLNFGVEFGHINPSSRPKDTIDEIVSNLQALIDALAKRGWYRNETLILKADILFSDQGPIIIEATPRTSGGWDSSYSSVQRNLNVQQLAVSISLGEKTYCQKGDATFVAVVSDVAENSVDCRGRTFFGGEPSSDRFLAIESAVKNMKTGRALGCI